MDPQDKKLCYHLENLDFYGKLEVGDKIYFYNNKKFKYTNGYSFDSLYNRIFKIIIAKDNITNDLNIIISEIYNVISDIETFKKTNYYELFKIYFERAINGLEHLYTTYNNENRNLISLQTLICEMKNIEV